ncbi:MAG: LUD domain-containing protein [Gemmatimonadota bacterium]|nr:MAG: LUD domain-containing protein [Gemmatimonadota bacterium]
MRDGILTRIRSALAGRQAVAHPGVFVGSPPSGPAIEAFADRFRAAGGEVERFSNMDEAGDWLDGFEHAFEGVAAGADVPTELATHLPSRPAREAPLGVSMARYAAADTGSLVLDSHGGQLPQLLPPTHLVWVRADAVVATLGEAIEAARGDLPSALALHSGPSKSADIGRVIVTGVHGPGRVVVGIVG